MPTRLTDIRINFISLVKNGANRREVIFKTGKRHINNLSKSVPIIKFNDRKNIMYGIVYAPDDLDTDREYANAGDIEKASQQFMRELNLHNIDVGHNFNRAGAFVAENWIIRKGDPLFPQETPGAWAVGIKLENDDLIAQASSGVLKALSMAGTANKIPESGSRVHKIAKAIKNAFRKGDDMDEKQVKAIVKEAIAKQEKPLTKEEMATVFKSAFESATEDLNERLEKLENATGGSVQGDGNISKHAKLEALGKEIAKSVNG